MIISPSNETGFAKAAAGSMARVIQRASRMLNRRRFIVGAPLDVKFVVVIFYYTAGGARCKGEQGENARNMSKSADEEGHTAQKQMETIGFLTKAGERLRRVGRLN